MEFRGITRLRLLHLEDQEPYSRLLVSWLRQALFKNFKVAGAVKAQLRIEAYNVFNHTQLNEVNTNPQWISPERN